MKKLFWSAILGVGMVLGVWGYFGGFRNVEINEAFTGPYYIVYQKHTGDYNKIGAIFDNMNDDFAQHGRSYQTKVAIFYDDPTQVPIESLRSDVGILVYSTDFARVDALSGEYLTKTLAQTQRLVTTFPYKNKLSFALGVVKVYPMINNHLKQYGYKQNVPRIEIYDDQDIQYLAELVHQVE